MVFGMVPGQRGRGDGRTRLLLNRPGPRQKEKLMLRTTRSILSALVVATLAGAAQADPVTFTWAPPASPANPNWNTPGNWTNTGSLTNTYPGDGRDNDIVVITNDADATVVLNVSVTISSITVNSGATLKMGESGTVRVLKVTAPAGVTIASGGTIDIGQTNQTYAARLQLEPTGSDTMPINGTLKLSNSNAEVRLNATGVTVTLNAIGTIGSIDNHGKVKSVDGTLVFGANEVITDNAGSQRYVADGSGAKLRFARAHAGLAGDFFVANSGSLDFLASIYTAGAYNLSCSSVTTGVGVTFTYDDGANECP
jgi:invasion protein IalB